MAQRQVRHRSTRGRSLFVFRRNRTKRGMIDSDWITTLVARIISGTDPQIFSTAPDRQADRDAIRTELERILSSHLFRNSRRCNTLLRYVVTEVLDGRGARLKERTIGMSAFGREPNYDTNEDTIVRTSAMEVRKRLAQYYHELGQEIGLRIDMASGSYVPEFHFLKPAVLSAEPVQRRSPPTVDVPPPVAATVPKLPHGRLLLVAVLVVGGLAAVIAIVGLYRPDPTQAFWGPFWHNTNTVIVAAGTSLDETWTALNQAGRGARATDGSELNSIETFRQDQLGFADATTIARAFGMIQSSGKQPEIKRAATVTLNDLRKAPAVFVGALNNPWTMRLNAPLRFNIVRDAASRVSQIVDREKAAPTPWKADPLAPYSQRTQDWAVISRFRDSRTEQTVLLLAGLGRDGTITAGEFVTQAKYLRALAEQLPAGWERKNLQVVIGTEVIDGNVGPPRILATHLW